MTSPGTNASLDGNKVIRQQKPPEQTQLVAELADKTTGEQPFIQNIHT